MPGTPAGEVLRALLWLGPERVVAAAAQLEGRLTATDRRALATNASAHMPDWLARPVARQAIG